MRPSILIVHPDRKTQRVVQRILGVVGHPIDVADDFDQALRLIPHLRPILLVIDGLAATSPRAREVFTAAETRGAVAVMSLLSGHGAAEAIPQILATGAITNLLLHPMPVLNEELAITAQKLLRNDLFGVEKYLLWGTSLEDITLRRARQRVDLVQQLAEQVRARNQSARTASTAMLVADELLSNAVHNAPVDADGNHYRADTPRDTDFDLDEPHRVRLRWGCDARYLAIEVTDYFGSLDRDTILRALGHTEVRETGEGAGMGLALAHRSCDHLVFNLAPGRMSEVIALIDVRYPPSERMTASSYNVFVERAERSAP